MGSIISAIFLSSDGYSPRFIRGKHRVRAFKIEMDVVIKSEGRTSGN